MPIRIRTKRLLISFAAAITFCILGGMAFTSYFMHAVYEIEDPKIDAEEVPAIVLETFNKRFPGAVDVEWELDGDLYEAEFVWKDFSEVEAAFETNGIWANSDFLVTIETLPEKARLYLQELGTYEILDIEKVQTRDHPMTYAVELGSRLLEWEIEFDDQGNLLSKERDGPVLE